MPSSRARIPRHPEHIGWATGIAWAETGEAGHLRLWDWIHALARFGHSAGGWGRVVGAEEGQHRCHAPVERRIVLAALKRGMQEVCNAGWKPAVE